jgi:hypothetical protein
MIANRVHAIIAAGLQHPELLTLWQQEPDQLRDYGVEPGDLDLNALWKFAGLTAKVRHNGLRQDLPLTFRLLNVAGLEIEVFASYASFAATEKRQFANTAVGRAQDLLSFLEHWLDFDKRAHALLWDLIRYELALTQLSRTAADFQGGKIVAPPKRLSGQSVPRIRADISLHEMSCDPRLLGVTLQEKSPQLENVPSGSFHFCYWRPDATTEVHILQLDELGYYLLSFADGERPAAELSTLLGGNRKPSRGFLKALAELAALGIMAFDNPRKETR